jgi:threonine dehydratase
MQVPGAEMDEFRAFLGRVGYDYVEETANPGYELFLG